MTRVEMDPRVGGKFLLIDRRHGKDIEHVGEYLEIDRPRRLVFTFAVQKFSAQSTLVSIDIVPVGTGCDLTLTHEGVLDEWLSRTQEGWGMILDGLANSLRLRPVVMASTSSPERFASAVYCRGPSSVCGLI